jgi:hypothetical protein
LREKLKFSAILLFSAKASNSAPYFAQMTSFTHSVNPEAHPLCFQLTISVHES